MLHKCFNQRRISDPTSRASRHAAQVLQSARFFASPERCEAANCLRSAATRLKFAARLKRFTSIPLPVAGHAL
jgi:hypothetical protein